MIFMVRETQAIGIRRVSKILDAYTFGSTSTSKALAGAYGLSLQLQYRVGKRVSTASSPFDGQTCFEPCLPREWIAR